MPIINLVYEAPEQRKPGANTLLYFPLTSDAVDTVNNVTLSSQGTTNYTEVGGVTSAEFTKSNWLYNTSVNVLPQGDVAKTMSFWSYTLGTNLGWVGIAQIGLNSIGKAFGAGIQYGSTLNVIMTRYGSTSNAYTTTTNQRKNVVITYNNSVWKMYINGTLEVIWNETAPIEGNNIYLGQGLGETGTTSTYYGHLSEFILEDKERTQAEITSYYDKTKSNYGL